MFNHNFDFGSSILTITSEKQIKEKILDQVFELIQFVKYDFNHKIHHSSAYRLNDVEENVPCPVTKEFSFYLQLNLDWTYKTNGQFNPFKIAGKKIENFKEILNIDNEDVVKTTDFIFESGTLMQHFLIDTISELLKKNKLKEFLVNTTNYYSASGERVWPVTFYIEDDKKFDAEIKENSIGLNFNDEYKSDYVPEEKFGGNEDLIRHKFAIFKSETAVENKVTSQIIKNLLFKSQYQDFCNTNNLVLKIYDVEDREYLFEPA